jgi:uncharacterized Zn finger protein (UPF0148 family)
VLEVVLIVQLLAPIVLGLPIWIWGNVSTKRRERARSQQASSAGGQRLVPLQCPACGAPVPLQREACPCPSCGATVTPPSEYVRMLELRTLATAELARAERQWRWSRWTSSPILGLLLVLASLAWFALVVYAIIEVDWSRWVDIVLLMTAGFLSAAGIFGAFGLADAGKKLPPLPASEFMHPPAASASCKHCSAPIAFATDELATICPYCGGDNYREAVARAAQLDASTQEQAASGSLLDAVRELDERRDMLFSIIGVSLIVELLYGFFALFGTCADWLNSP